MKHLCLPQSASDRAKISDTFRNRLGHLDDEKKIILLRILDEIIKFNGDSLKKEAISAIFQIALKALQQHSSLTIEKTTRTYERTLLYW